MKTLFAILMFVISFSCFSQNNLRVNYNKIIDFDGKVRKEYAAKGTWYVTQDSVLIQKYSKDSLIYNTLEVKNKRVLYKNDYDEIVEVVFMNKNVTVKNALRPNEYLIFKEE
jgi:archaeosine-15-forming tRNA-guanine transglycosylase